LDNDVATGTDDHECGKLKTRQICRTDNKCAWIKTTKQNKRGKFRWNCDLANKATIENNLQKKKEHRMKKN